ncbi:hypothetical protein WMY93_014713 [Mugilogobius chulae]|uniref:Uncharacterized protein n=1 Tax=Mugilogobius chulae TaxID=88201 RepID=A0AAW0NW65_9GOBI
MLLCTLFFFSLVHSTFTLETLGTVISYYPKTKHSDGSVEVVVRMLVISRDCSPGFWQCYSGECGNVISAVSHIIYEDEDEYCQVEQVFTLHVPTNAPFVIRSNLDEDGDQDNLEMNETWKNLTEVDLRTRSDTGKANSSPQTSVLPNIRVPVNCQRNYQLLKFDPDGDDIQCRLLAITHLKCDNCDAAALLPSFFNSEPCMIKYTPNLIQPGNQLKVNQIMEDFPKTSLNLTYTNGTKETRTSSDSIGKVPVQFIFTVDSSVPDCKEGLYLPKFFTRLLNMKPNSAELLHNGPLNMTVVRTGLKEFALVWSPTEEQVNHHPVCYALQVTSKGTWEQVGVPCLRDYNGRPNFVWGDAL